jgi:hypothetical protein
VAATDPTPPRMLFGLGNARVVTGAIGQLHLVGSRPQGEEGSCTTIGEDEGSRRVGPDACVVAGRDTRRAKLVALLLAFRAGCPFRFGRCWLHSPEGSV